MTPQFERDLRWGAILEASQRGETKDYETLLREVSEVLKSYFARHNVESALCEDLTQETLLAIHRARHTYMPGRPFQAWMYAIARNKLVDALRAKKVSALGMASADESALEELEATPSIGGLGALRAALATLSSKQRNVIALLKFEGFSIKSVASQLGLSESDVKVTAHRAQKALRDALQA
jgi:RNA polymerase sigma-70 factor (ECF subfamily)